MLRSTMNEQDRQDLKLKIEQEIESITKQLAALEEGIKPVPPDDALGRLTRLDAIQSQEMNQNTYRQSNARIVGLKGALDRLDEPGFGLCIECDNPIPLGRLKLMPGTRHCVNCAAG